MKLKILRNILIGLVLIGIGFASGFFILRHVGTIPEWLCRPVTVTSEPIDISYQINSPGNQLQPYASVRLTVVENKLYMYIPMTSSVVASPYDGYLCVFKDGGIQRVKRINDTVLDLWNGSLYYNVSNNNTGTKSFVCYQISSGEDVTIVTYNHRISKTEAARSGAEGQIYYPANNSSSLYYCIQETRMVDTGCIESRYRFGDNIYTYVKGESNGKYTNTIIAADIEGNILRDYQGSVGNGSCRVIPCETGLIIHNSISPDMLYLIAGDSGDVIELFSVDGERTLSAVNVYQEYVYLSFLRYRDYDQLWFGRFENDSQEGTYRINLKNGSVEKISDKIYNGLYIFDDSGIFACDSNNNVYKLNFDGNVIMTLLEH